MAKHAACGCALGRVAVQQGIQVIKAKQAVPEYDDIEAIQDAMAAALMAEWTALAETGIAKAEAHLAGKATVTAAHVTQAVKKLQAPFSAWPSKDAVAMVEEAVAEMYKLAQTAILNKHAGTKGYGVELVFKAALEATFNVIDQQAVDQLAKHQVFWLRDHYDLATTEGIEAAALGELEGMHGQAAGEALRKEAERIHGVGAFSSSGAHYFAGVAVNAATTARVNGSILEMEELGIEFYEIVNPMDEHTTDICADLNGKLFPVKEAAKRVRELVEAEDPRAVKDLHPWSPNDYADVFKDLGVTVEQGKPIPPSAAQVLAEAGYGMPPYHFKCRTTVDVG